MNERISHSDAQSTACAACKNFYRLKRPCAHDARSSSDTVILKSAELADTLQYLLPNAALLISPELGSNPPVTSQIARLPPTFMRVCEFCD